MKKINIAIDGPSGSGKSSLAKAISKKFGLTYINTGLVYRAIALKVIKTNTDIDNHSAIESILKDGMIELFKNDVVFLDGVDVSLEVRRDNVSQLASKTAAIPSVRKWAAALQKSYANIKGTIMDGRDTTFNIMPNADLKIFLDTDPEIRAKRRFEQNEKLGFINNNYDDILEEIKERDHRDRTREVDPVHKTDDAVLIDSSHMTLEEVIDKVSSLVEQLTK